MPALSGGMMLYSRRSAKSVACSRLKVIGVNEFFFFPVFVAAFTSADEFHSVSTTGCPAALSHFARSASCVVFPEPSMPSTTNSFPGYSWGVVSLFNMRFPFLQIQPGQLEPYRPAEYPFERTHVPVRRPEFQLRFVGRSEPRQVIILPRIEIDAGNRLRVAAVETFGQPDHGGQSLDDPLQFRRKVLEPLVRLLRHRLAVIARNERDDLDLLRFEPAQIAVLDQVVGVLVVPLVTDVHADVVQQGAVFEPLTLGVA